MSKINVSLQGKTVFITGGSRGIGEAIALKLAKEGSNIVLVAKTSEPHPKLPGTIYTVSEKIKKLGVEVLPIVTDIRNENQIDNAVKQAVQKFGGIDILINNASAIWLKGTLETPMKKFDLMNQINVSAEQGRNPHILNLSPPLNMNSKWFKNHVAYTISKYGMSMCVLGMSEEFKDDGIAVNALWPRTGIATAAISWIASEEALNSCRKPSIMADAACYILKRNSRECTGNFFIDDEVLLSEGVSREELEKYAINPGTPLMIDFFLDNSPIKSKL